MSTEVDLSLSPQTKVQNLQRSMPSVKDRSTHQLWLMKNLISCVKALVCLAEASPSESRRFQSGMSCFIKYCHCGHCKQVGSNGRNRQEMCYKIKSTLIATLFLFTFLYRLFIKYCVFSEILKCSGLWPFYVFPRCQCVYTTRQVEHQRCSRTSRVQKNPKILRKKHNI